MSITDWWASYDSFAQVLWGCAIIGSTFFIFQLASALLLGDSDSAFGDSDELVETDQGVGYQFFTFRNLVIFVTMLGWFGLGTYAEDYSKLTSIVVGVLAGTVMVFIMAWLMSQINKLKQDGSMKIDNAIGKVGTVYIPIPANQEGKGKVQLAVQGSTHELDAVTKETETLSTGTAVSVVAVRPGNVLIVEKLK